MFTSKIVPTGFPTRRCNIPAARGEHASQEERKRKHGMHEILLISKVGVWGKLFTLYFPLKMYSLYIFQCFVGFFSKGKSLVDCFGLDRENNDIDVLGFTHFGQGHNKFKCYYK